MTFQLYSDFIIVAKKYASNQTVDDGEDIVSNLKKIVVRMPLVHYNTLKYLMRHLRRISHNCAVNNMPPSNLGIIFGPTLLRREYVSTLLSLTTFSYGNTFILTATTQTQQASRCTMPPTKAELWNCWSSMRTRFSTCPTRTTTGSPLVKIHSTEMNLCTQRSLGLLPSWVYSQAIHQMRTIASTSRPLAHQSYLNNRTISPKQILWRRGVCFLHPLSMLSSKVPFTSINLSCHQHQHHHLPTMRLPRRRYPI